MLTKDMQDFIRIHFFYIQFLVQQGYGITIVGNILLYLAINLFCIFNNTYQGSKKRDCSNLTFIFSFIGITYLLVYRTDKYKKLTAEVEKDSKKCEYLCYCRVFNYLLFSDQESWTTIQCL